MTAAPNVRAAVLGSPPFGPRSVPGLKLWLTADALSLSDGDPVSAWPDSSGQGNTATQATGAKQPLYKAAQVNNRPVVRFDGIDDWVKTAAFALPQPSTVYIVLRQITWASERRVFDDIVGNALTLIQRTATPGLALYAGGGGVSPTTTSLAVGSFGIVACVYNGNDNSLIAVNAAAGSTGALTGTASASGFTLGANAAISLPSNIDVAEVAVYSGAHDAATRTALKNYLNARYLIF